MFSKTTTPISWEYFELQWGRNFHHAKNIMGFLEIFPQRFSEFGIQIQNKNDIIQLQKDWINLVNQLDTVNEKSFFKPYWMPIDKESLDYFIDLSDISLPIFEINYFMPTDEWFVTYLTHDITEVMTSFNKPDSKLTDYLENSYNEMLVVTQKICDASKKKSTKPK